VGARGGGKDIKDKRREGTGQRRGKKKINDVDEEAEVQLNIRLSVTQFHPPVEKKKRKKKRRKKKLGGIGSESRDQYQRSA